MTAPKKAKLSISLQKQNLSDLKTIAAHHRVSVTSIVSRLIAEYLSEEDNSRFLTASRVVDPRQLTIESRYDEAEKGK